MDHGLYCFSQFLGLVNGSPLVFFEASRGLRQGCPLSPLLFILAIKRLNLLINDAKCRGTIKGVKISRYLALTYQLFVDDVVVFGIGTLDEWAEYKDKLYLFY